MLDLENRTSSSVVENSDITPSNFDSLITKDTFKHRHLGIDRTAQQLMLETLGYDSLDSLIDTAVPESIRLHNPLELPSPLTETEALNKLKSIAQQNKVYRSYIGMGYYNCITPAVIQRNILENPNWYTAYTPYQPEIAQGRLEALLNFQTMIID